ncbi:hypothetical protein PIB30_002572 [Stylosanthes scabra]|uniref:Transposase (Putative), gypsy type n=1 Tax=Stylosanthes scabra TaxID=79078 RepID=A0ABU6Z3U0_9FABA|nr:hypothetical protein [Stylosanthes scabra]
MEDSGMEGDYVLEAAGPSDQVPFRANEGGPHFLWVYQEYFTRLGARLPFSEFQKEVMARCRVAASQLHLNGWGFILTFEKVCLHYGFRPTIRLFFYIYDVLFSPTGKGYVSFRAHQGRKLLGAYEESIQEFKSHYFKVLAAPGKRVFWLDEEGDSFSWVYWNPEVKDFTVFNLDPLEMAACDFLLSLPAGLPKKKNEFSCRWILDHSDVEVGKFLDNLLSVKMKQTKLERMMTMLADPTKMAPQTILAVKKTSRSAQVPASSEKSAGTSAQGPSSTSGVPKAKKDTSKRKRPEVVTLEGEDGLREDRVADLKRKKRKQVELGEDELCDRVVGKDVAWEHEVNPLDLAFPNDYDYKKALDARLTTASIREPLLTMPPDQLLGTSWRLSCQSLLVFRAKEEKELLAAQDQIAILRVERDLAMAYLPLKEKVDTLTDQFTVKEGERQSALERVSKLEEDIKVLETQLKSCRSALYHEQKRAEVAKKRVEDLTFSLHKSQFDLGVDLSAITLESRWDPKGRRIYVPEHSLEIDPVAKELPPVEVSVPETTPETNQPEAAEQVLEPVVKVGEGGECPT